ncbi:MAG: carbohydrate-binding domain-containing protein [Lachnospiraceae bacterium]|nr:carbohydrate-binding domain-containing protein [Lachnospiraceae bacterium]
MYRKYLHKIIRKGAALLLAGSLIFALAACGNDSGSTEQAGSQSGQTAEASANTPSGTAADPVTDDSIKASETTAAFSLTTSDGQFAQSGEVYKITAAGTYMLSGALEGQIVVDAGDDDEVILELNGVTLTYAKDSPVKILNADKVEISAKSGTENVIKDIRSAKTAEQGSQGEGAVYAKTDLKFKGTGTLVITAGYNNGIHTTKDLTIQKLSLKVTAVNTAIKGGDSVTVKSGAVVAISTNGDGIKTENTNANKSGDVRGDIMLTGGAVTVYAAGDGFQAAHDFNMEADNEGNVPSVLIYTGSYSGYTASNASTSSYKGVKVQNKLLIEAGAIEIHSYDDGLHADYGTAFEAGGKGTGSITISGGTVTISVYSPENKTAGGRPGRGGWGGQQTVQGADGIHADYKLTIAGGTVTVDSAYEGLEANVIAVSGGTTKVSGNDDGINATKGVEAAQILVTGGYLEVEVSPNGDTDGIDSNGSYSQSGGIVIAKGPNNQNMAAIDADGTATMSGGTLIVLGYGWVQIGSSVKSYSLSLHSAGSQTVKIGGVSYSFTNANAYGKTSVYSDVSVSK